MVKEKILVSSCLLGINCKYNGQNNLCDLEHFLKDYDVVHFCPEVAGGLSTPRIPCEIINDSVISKEGIDCTKEFNKGAQLCLELCTKHNITKAILKEKSPSCGRRQVYDGNFSGNLIDGSGVTTKLLLKNNIVVYSEVDIIKLK